MESALTHIVRIRMAPTGVASVSAAARAFIGSGVAPAGLPVGELAEWDALPLGEV